MSLPFFLEGAYYYTRSSAGYWMDIWARYKLHTCETRASLHRKKTIRYWSWRGQKSCMRPSKHPGRVHNQVWKVSTSSVKYWNSYKIIISQRRGVFFAWVNLLEATTHFWGYCSCMACMSPLYWRTITIINIGMLPHSFWILFPILSPYLSFLAFSST